MNMHTANPLYMVQLWLEAQRLINLARMLHLPLHNVDNNYIVHCALGELFQDQAPNPFCVEDKHRLISDYDDEEGRLLRVLGYSSVDTETLKQLASGFASPEVYNICRWDRAAAKPLPGYFPEGLDLQFELRACPVVRKASDGPKWKKGQEVDAFLAHVWELDDREVEAQREPVYRKWLERHFEERGGAKPKRIRLERFSIERMVRRTNGNERKTRIIKRPDVTLSGTLTVIDSPAFMQMLENGIGRHTSFGFGMLKVRRA